jgi:hypothetical protein
MANATEFKMLHMLTFDSLRTPSFTLFANPDYFVTGSTACGTSVTNAASLAKALDEFFTERGRPLLGSERSHVDSLYLRQRLRCLSTSNPR